MNKYEKMQELGLLPTKTKVATYIDNNRAESREEHRQRLEDMRMGVYDSKKYKTTQKRDVKPISVLSGEQLSNAVWSFIKGDNNKALKEFDYLYCGLK